jgi:membrane carboxypeptidase/penicillin-binding protein
VVVLDPGTGEVLALVGGRDFQQSKFNRATQARRQPGSAFKPIVYAAAVEAGLAPVHPLEDRPMQVRLDGGRVWTPRNYGGSYAGVLPMRQALVQSRNVATVRLAQEVGLRGVERMARQLGLTSPMPPVPSVSIGAAEVGVLELTAAYAPFATLGRRAAPRLVTRVEDRDGRVVWPDLPAQLHQIGQRIPAPEAHGKTVAWS